MVLAVVLLAVGIGPRWAGNWEALADGAPATGRPAHRPELLFIRSDRWSGRHFGLDGQIMVEGWTGAGPHPLTPVAMCPTFAAWSPSGQHVAFMQTRVDAEGRATHELHVCDAASGADTVLPQARPCRYAQPVWSPDGRAIAFATGRSNDGGLCLAAWPSGAVRRLTGPGSPEGRPFWSADGRSMIFIRRGQGHRQAVVLDVRTRSERIASAPGEDWADAQWIGDQGGLCYARQLDGYAALMVCEAANLRPRELAVAPGRVWDMAPSPDGRTVALSARNTVTGGAVVQLIPVDGSACVEVPAPSPEGYCPLRLTWSPDGHLLAFDAEEGGQRGVFVLDVGELLVERVTDSAQWDRHPDWRPAEEAPAG